MAKTQVSAVFGMDMMDGKPLPPLDSMGRPVVKQWAPYKTKATLTAALLSLRDCSPMFWMEVRNETELHPKGLAFVCTLGMKFPPTKVVELPQK